MKILIIGGTGLISTAITRRLLQRGHHVTLFNRGRTASRLPASTGEVVQVTGDRTLHAEFEARVRDLAPFDCVVDMVCFTPADAQSLVRAFDGRTAQIIFCSTANVYHLPAERYPIREADALGASGAYGARKAECEAILRGAHERGAFGVTTLRVAHAYGEGRPMLHPLGADTAFVDRLRKGKPVVVHGDGQGLWAACHVDDTARAFAGAAGNGDALGRCYNVAGTEWLTWDRYMQLFAAAAGAPPPRIVHIPAELLARAVPAVGQRCVDSYQHPKIFDTSAAQRDLGFTPRVPFLEGVRRTIGWLEAHGQIEDSDAPAHGWYERLIEAWTRLGDGLTAALGAGA